MARPLSPRPHLLATLRLKEQRRGTKSEESDHKNLKNRDGWTLLRRCDTLSRRRVDGKGSLPWQRTRAGQWQFQSLYVNSEVML